MTTYESNIKTISHPQLTVFEKLSDLHHLETFKSKINDPKIKELRVEDDTIWIKVDMLGEIGLKLIEKEPIKTLKFEGVKTPVALNFWIQLVQVAETETKLKLTLKAELPMMVKAMASKPIKEFLEKLSEAITQLPYN